MSRGALPLHERMTRNYCTHIIQAREAHQSKSYAKVVTINLPDILSKVCDESLEKALISESSDGDINVYLLPGDNIAVPLLGTEKNEFLTDFVHLRDLKCSLDTCSKKTKSKLHTLVLKGTPVCQHSLLGLF